MSDQQFSGRCVFITGAGAGLGKATALAFAAQGGRVVIAELDPVSGEATAAEIRAAGGEALFVDTDATNEAQVERAIAAAVEAFGPIRHAVNNVGAPRGSTITGTSLEEWDWSVKMCLTTAFLAMKHEIPVMQAAGGGTIVNIASNTAAVYTPAAPPAYCAAKGAVIQLTHYASCMHGREGIRVNSVSPGLSATDLVMKNLPPHVQHEVTSTTQVVPRLTEPHEIAAAVIYLSSDAAAMVNGLDIEVGGGRLF
ncbi:MAG: hypothetical protein RL481_107 [Pseudomonadota bacterium]